MSVCASVHLIRLKHLPKMLWVQIASKRELILIEEAGFRRLNSSPKHQHRKTSRYYYDYYYYY